MGNFFIDGEQYKEIKDFYVMLGFTEKQAEKLTARAFDGVVKADNTRKYCSSWNFYNYLLYSVQNNTWNNYSGSLLNSGWNNSSSLWLNSGWNNSSSSWLNSGWSNCSSGGWSSDESYSPGVSAEETITFNTAQTNHVDELSEMNPLDDAKLIFSANVNNASWSYVRNTAVSGNKIDSSFIRIEEMINSVSHDLKIPEKNDFALTVQTGECPWKTENELLFIGVKAKKEEKNRRNNFVFLVDVSGSMDGYQIIVQMSIMSLISCLEEGDTISIITYSNDTKTIARNIDCGNKDNCIDAVLSIHFDSGYTDGSSGLEEAYNYLENCNKNDNNRVFIFTDGDFNFGVTSEGGLADFIKKKKETGTYLSIVGYGLNNFKDNNMEALARNGNGNYFFVGQPADIIDSLKNKFESTSITVAKNVKIQVELNPEFVGSYRLIGYNARKLTTSDFDNKEKSVDGIGSGHYVVALIEFSRCKAEKNSSSRYVFNASKENTNEFATVTIRYQSPNDEHHEFVKIISPEEAVKNTSNINSEKSAFLASYGMWLSGSEYKSEMTPALLKNMRNSLECYEEMKSVIQVFDSYELC